jgi:LacI family xylobiose transport system transcriptional regulator
MTTRPGQAARHNWRAPRASPSWPARSARYAEPMSAETSESDDLGAGRARATLAEVASLADVSISTVSKVLNGRSGVSDETRARIESLLQDHAYNRRNSGPNQAPLLEVLCFEIDSLWSAVAIAAIERLARENGVGVVVSGTHSRYAPDDGWFEGMLGRRATAVILVATDMPVPLRQQLRSRGIPLVMLDPTGSPAPDVPTIGSADWTGAYGAARHLIDLGHRDIAIITGPEDMMVATARLSGFRAALDGAGIPLQPEFVRHGAFHHRDGVEQGHALLSLPKPPTAIFATADVHAFGVYEAARALGVSIPTRLSVVGFDDLQIASWVSPALTTVRVPIAEMAEQAAQLALRLRDEEEPSISRIDMATTLVVRDSTAAPFE